MTEKRAEIYIKKLLEEKFKALTSRITGICLVKIVVLFLVCVTKCTVSSLNVYVIIIIMTNVFFFFFFFFN